MLISLVFMVVFFFALGVYAAENSGTHAVTLFNYTWTAVPDWLPAVVSAVAMLLLMLLYAGYARVRHHVGRLSLRRRIDDNESLIARLREENEGLRRDPDARQRGGRVVGEPSERVVRAG